MIFSIRKRALAGFLSVTMLGTMAASVPFTASAADYLNAKLSIYENKAWTSSTSVVGHANKNLSVEALKISLTGDDADGATIKYSVYENKKWLSASNGKPVGNANKKLSIEALKISLANIDGYSVSYSVYENKKWYSAADGVAVGHANKGWKVEAVKINIKEKAPAAVTPTISSVATIPDVEVSNGTDANGAAALLPTSASVTLSDGTTTDAPITAWAAPSDYGTGTTAGTYTFTGTLGAIDGVDNTDDVQATANVVVDAANPLSSVSAVNGTVTANFATALTAAPAVADFAVTQSINGAAATTVTPTGVTLDSTGKIVTLTVPQVVVAAASQSVVFSVSYKGGAALSAPAFTVANASAITVAATGAQLLAVTFDQPVDPTKAVIKVAKTGYTVNQSVAPVFSADDKTATVTLSAKMTAGDYTVSVTGLTTDALTSTITVKDETITKIVLPTVANLDRADTSNKTLDVYYKVYNQYGEDMTSVATGLVLTASKGTATASASTGIIQILASSAYAAGDTVTLSTVDPTSGTFIASTLTVQSVSSVANMSITQLYNADGATLQVGNTSDPANTFDLLILASDQNGNAITDSDYFSADTIVSASNSAVASAQSNADGTPKCAATNITVNGTSYIALPLNPTISAGTSTISLISKTSGKIATYVVTVKDASKVDVLTLSQPAVAVDGEITDIPLTAVDQFGTAMTSATSIINTMLSGVIASNGAIATITQDYVNNVSYVALDLKTTPLGLSAGATQNVVISGVTGTGKVLQFTVPIRSAATPTSVVGTTSDYTANLALGGTSTLQNSYITVNDQYNRAITPSASYGYTITTSDPTIETIVDKTTPATTISSGTIKVPSTDVLSFEGLKTGTVTITITVDTVAGSVYTPISGSTYTYTSRVVGKSDIASYSLSSISKLYAGATTTDTTHGVTTSAGTPAGYEEAVTVYGVLADGSKVLVPETGIDTATTHYYSIYAADSSVAEDGTTSTLTDADTDSSWENSAGVIATSRTVPIIVTVDGATTTTTLTTTLTVATDAPAISTVALNTASDSTTGYVLESTGVISFNKISLTGATDAAIVLNLANNAKVVTSTDQYGVTIANAFTKAFITNHVNASGTAVTTDDTFNAGDSFNVTAITASGTILPFKVILK
jgi:Bacterial Ig-like domain (group 4)./Clostridial hydrophobic W.